MTVEEHVGKARQWVSSAPSTRVDDLSAEECYSRANYHMLCALVQMLSAPAEHPGTPVEASQQETAK